MKYAVTTNLDYLNEYKNDCKKIEKLTYMNFTI